MPQPVPVERQKGQQSRCDSSGQGWTVGHRLGHPRRDQDLGAGAVHECGCSQERVPPPRGHRPLPWQRRPTAQGSGLNALHVRVQQARGDHGRLFRKLPHLRGKQWRPRRTPRSDRANLPIVQPLGRSRVAPASVALVPALFVRAQSLPQALQGRKEPPPTRRGCVRCGLDLDPRWPDHGRLRDACTPVGALRQYAVRSRDPRRSCPHLRSVRLGQRGCGGSRDAVGVQGCSAQRRAASRGVVHPPRSLPGRPLRRHPAPCHQAMRAVQGAVPGLT